MPPVDTSRIEHGVAPVVMTGVTQAERDAVPDTPEEIGLPSPTFEIEVDAALEWGPDGKLRLRRRQ